MFVCCAKKVICKVPQLSFAFMNRCRIKLVFQNKTKINRNAWNISFQQTFGFVESSCFEVKRYIYEQQVFIVNAYGRKWY